MGAPSLLARSSELLRFYQAALVNTAFGYGLYVLLIWLGLQVYVAQTVGYVCGIAFNYFTYSRHVFFEKERSKIRFVLSYVMTYFVYIGLMRIFHPLLNNDYVAGAIVTFLGSLVNYFALKYAVFVRPRT